MPGRGPTRRYTQEEEDELIAYFALSIDIPPSKRSSAHSYRDFTARVRHSLDPLFVFAEMYTTESLRLLEMGLSTFYRSLESPLLP